MSRIRLLAALISVVMIGGLLIFRLVGIGAKHDREPRSTNVAAAPSQVPSKQDEPSLESREQEPKADQPDEFVKMDREIRTRYGKSVPEYPANYKLQELGRAVTKRFGVSLQKYGSSTTLNRTASLPWQERGPGNVSGRTRGLIVDPDDPTGNTWFAGSVGGGIWKTTNGGQVWVDKTPGLPNLSTTVLAMAASNHNVIFAGTGEGFFNVDAVNGDGIFKSTDHGETWVQIPSTAGNVNFQNVNRIVVDPTAANTLLACANPGFYAKSSTSGIFRSTDGGTSWSQVYNSGSLRVQQIVANPANFQTLFATVNTVGVIKSTDGGLSWNPTSGISTTGRAEIAVAPTDTNRIYAGVESAAGSDLYISDDAGATWLRANDTTGTNVNWLNGQGWYDNTIAVHPYAKDTLFVGGLNISKIVVKPGTTFENRVTGVSTTNTSSFLAFVNFGLPYLGGGLGTGADFYGTVTTPLNLLPTDYVSVEIRFGPGISQKAHRFFTGTNFLYPYRDYVTVPFQAWDVTNNRQLTLSFRDQADNGVYDLSPTPSGGVSREYIFVNAVPYDSTSADTNIARTGGERYKNIYAVGPALATGATWDPNNLPASKISITYGQVTLRRRGTAQLTNWFTGTSFPYVHADQHNLITIPVNQGTNSFRVLNGNDGGASISSDGGKSWTQIVGYNSTQFYGADKKPGASVYIGGMQDNGTWLSGNNPTASSPYTSVLGGDGFEVSWNYANTLKIIGSVQYNSIRRSTDGGTTWATATSGLLDVGSSTGTFITKVAKTNSDPDLLFAVGASGVWRSDDFATSWTLSPIPSATYGYSSSFTCVQISQSNPRFVWAGARMDASGKIQVSRDGGLSFTPTSTYVGATLGRISGLSTHPLQDSTAYVLFSIAQAPKILRTTDLGGTWTDISGFGSGTTSTNGFPDVATYCLLVNPVHPDTLWVGTEIGLFESTNNGSSWALAANGFPAVSIWDMKIVDDQAVIATHGRGIWSVSLPELSGYMPPIAVLSPRLNPLAQGPDGSLAVPVSLRSAYDSAQVIVNGISNLSVVNTTAKDTTLRLPVTVARRDTVSVVAYKNGQLYKSSTKAIDVRVYSAPQPSYANNFNATTTDFAGTGFTITTPAKFANGAIHSSHPYSNNTNNTYQLLIPIVVASSNATLKYDDIAIVEPGDSGSVFGSSNFFDYVIVEGTLDGLNWVPLLDGYDARSDAAWLAAWRTAVTGDSTMFRSHTIDLLSKFAAGKTILVRFRLFADASANGWGWAIDNLAIQTASTSVSSGPEIPKSFSLAQNYPNPFNPSTTIKYDLPVQSRVLLRIYDVLGREVRTLVDGPEVAGSKSVQWDGKNGSGTQVATGMYIYKLEAGKFTRSLKMLFLK